MIGDLVEADAKGKRAALRDPLTLESVVHDGKPAVVALRDLKEVELPRIERKAVADAAQALALWSNDFDKRVSAIQRAGERASVESLPARPNRQDRSIRKNPARGSREHRSGPPLGPGRRAADRLQAARDLGALDSARGRSVYRLPRSNGQGRESRQTGGRGDPRRSIGRRSPELTAIRFGSPYSIASRTVCRWHRF